MEAERRGVMGNRKRVWLAIAVVALLFCGFGMGVLPGSTGLLRVKQVYAMYEVYEIYFPKGMLDGMAAVTRVYVPAGQNTAYLPIRAGADTEVPPSYVRFLRGLVIIGDDLTMPYSEFRRGINDGITGLVSRTLTAQAYRGLATLVNSVSVDIELAPLPDMDENGIPEVLGVNSPYAIGWPSDVGVDYTAYVGLVPSADPVQALGGVTVFSVIANVEPTGVTPEITNVMVGSDTDAFQDVLFQVGLPAEDLPPEGWRFVARAAPEPGDISADLGALTGLPAESADVVYMVTFDAHVVDSLLYEPTGYTPPLTISVELLDGATELDAMPIFKADTSLDSDYNVVVAGTPFAQLPVPQVVENNELVFEVDGLSTYVVVWHADAPVLDPDDPNTIAPVFGPKAGCTDVSIVAYGAVDPGAAVRFGGNDATDVVITPFGAATLITCVTPAGDVAADAPYDVDVFVVNFPGTVDEVFAMVENGFTYEESSPSITSINPTAGSPGQTFTITGTEFDPDAVVTFDYMGTPATIISVACDRIVARVPSVAPGWYEVHVTNPDGGDYDYIDFEVREALGRGGSGGPCFIATAAYGTPATDQLETLRTFRDRYLLTNAAGTALMRAYYKYSPAVANVVATNSLLRALTRTVLTAIVTPLWLKLALVTVAAGAVAFIRRRVTA